MMSNTDTVRKAVVFMADGMEMCECLLTVDILRRAGVDVTTASVMDRREVTSSHKVMIYADAMAEDVDFTDVDMIVLPGGRVGTENLGRSSVVEAQCQAFAACNGQGDAPLKYVAAVCAAPSVLSALGILDGKKATCHPDFAEKVMLGSSFYDKSASGDPAIMAGVPDSIAVPDSSPLVNLTRDGVVIDGSIITGRGLGATMDFALCLAEILMGKETADKIAGSICYKG